ncbi:hypothetical protein F4703DRAFT_1923266 [Phycomyces blakesleeanus]
MPSTASVASASGTFLPVGLLLPTGRPFPPTSEPVISRQWTFLHSRRLPVVSCHPPIFLPLAGPFISLVGDIYPTDTSSKADKAHQKPNMGASKKVTPAHKKGQSMRQKKRANRPTRKVTVCASKKGKLPHKKGYSMCQIKHQSGPQERLMLQMRTREKMAFQRPSRSLSRFKAKSR